MAKYKVSSLFAGVCRGTVYQYRRYYFLENKSKVCPALTENMGGSGYNIPIVLDATYLKRVLPKFQEYLLNCNKSTA